MPENLGEILINEPPLIVAFGNWTSSWWWHVWKRGDKIRDDRRALLAVIPDVARTATTWDPVQQMEHE